MGTEIATGRGAGLATCRGLAFKGGQIHRGLRLPALGAVFGDFLDKPVESGGLALSRYAATAALLVFVLACVTFFEHEPATASH